LSEHNNTDVTVFESSINGNISLSEPGNNKIFSLSEHSNNETVPLMESCINENVSLSVPNNNVDMNVLIDHPYCNQGNSIM